MIQYFGNMVQQDGIQLYKYFNNSSQYSDDAANKKVYLAGVRVLSALGMVIGGFIAISSLPHFLFNPLGAAGQVALGLALFALSHDVFVMAKNETEQDANPAQKVAANVLGLVKDVIDLAKGQKDINDAPRQPITEGTFFRPLWDKTNLPEFIVRA